MLQLTSSRLKKVIDSWVKASGLDISENQYTQCNDLIGKMLSGGNCLTREEIEMELGHAGVPVTGDRVRRYVLRAEMEGIVCSMPSEYLSMYPFYPIFTAASWQNCLRIMHIQIIIFRQIYRSHH